MQLRRALIAYQVIGNSDQAFAAGNSCRISDRLRGPFGFEGKRQQKPVVAGPAIEHVKPRQQLEFARAVADGFSDLKTTPQCRFGLIAVALGKHESVSEGRLQLQFPCAAAARIVEHRKRAARPQACFVQQVEFDKQPGAGCGQRHAQSSALIIGESPLQRGTRVGKQERASPRTRGLVATARICRRRLQRVLDIAGMPARDPGRFTAVGELLRRISPGGVKKPITRHGAVWPYRDQRLGNELLQRIHNALSRIVLLACDHGRALQREGSGEDGKATESDPLALADQTIAPVQRCTEGLLARRRRPPSAPLQLQPAIEQRHHLAQSMRADPHGGEFDRQRNAVELAAYFGENLGVFVGNLRAMPRRGSPFSKQARSRIGQHLACAQPRALRWPLKRTELEDLLAFHKQRLAAGDEDADPGRLLVDALRHPGDGLDDMLATVEDQQQAAAAEVTDDAVGRIRMVHHEPKGPGDRARDKPRILHHAEVEKANLTVELRREFMRQRDRNGRLADSTRPPERDEPFAQQTLRNFPHNVISSDHPLQAVRQDRRGHLGRAGDLHGN